MQCRYCEQKSAILRPAVAGGQLPAHFELAGQRREGRLEGFQIKACAKQGPPSAQSPLDAHEEEAQSWSWCWSAWRMLAPCS